MGRFVGFIGPSYTLNSKNVDCQRAINLYAELDEVGTGKEREVAALLGTPGLRTLLELPTAPYRGSWTSSKGILYAVGGNKLYSISSVWVATELGTLNTAAGMVSMADNGLQLMVVDGTNGYVWDLTALTFTTIVDEAFPGADVVVFQDGYFIFNIPGTQKFGITGLNEVTFDALDVASSEGDPDNVVSLISANRSLWLANEKSIEVFFNSGNADFPFERIQGAFIEQGLWARFSLCKANGSVYWLGRDEKGAGVIFQSAGYQPKRISTHAIENAIRSYGDCSSATAYTYHQNGHYFYVINFPNAKTTWAFDSTTNLWHERAFNNRGVLERHRAQTHAFAYATHIVGDYATGKIYEMDTDIYSDDGIEIRRIRAAPHITDGLKRITHDEFQLDVESGVGLDGNTQGTDPQAMLQFSDDGGHTWSNEKWASLGKIGQTRYRAIWRRLGMSRDRVYRVSVSDPVKVVFIGAELTLSKAVG